MKQMAVLKGMRRGSITFFLYSSLVTSSRNRGQREGDKYESRLITSSALDFSTTLFAMPGVPKVKKV